MTLPRSSFTLRLVLGLCGFLVLVMLLGQLGRPRRAVATDPQETGPGRTPGELARRNRELLAQARRLAPTGIYIVIDTGRNILSLRRGPKTLREAVISSGSGNILKEPNGTRLWVFDTPRGLFTVQAKIKDPYWVKPDWAFIEEAEPIPKRVDERIEGGVLGEYALSFGNGYFIHGTLYTRMLGRNVTHGCIRVGDEDLEAVYRAVSVGTRIFIF